MPSYYDSTKKKPGKAKLKYAKGGKVKMAKGGKVKKMAKGGKTVARGSGAARTQYFGKNG